MLPNTQSTTPTVTATPQRHPWLDVLRGFAVLWMIEVHLLDVALWPILKQGWFYEKLYFYNGTVAPIFLFCAGASFWINFENQKIQNKAWHYVKRCLFILLVAYWLNTPLLSLSRSLANPDYFFKRFFCSDILHTLALSGLFAFTLSRLFKNRKAFIIASSLSALFIYFISYPVWLHQLYLKLPLPFSSFLAPFPLSKFTLLPWMGHFFAGISLTALYQNSRNKIKFALVLFAIAAISPSILFWIKSQQALGSVYNTYLEELWWRASAGCSFLRLAHVTLFFSAFITLQHLYPFKGKLIEAIKNIGQESLFFYVAHIALVYGTLPSRGLRTFGSGAWGWLGISIAYLVLVSSLYITAQAWHQFKKQNPQSVTKLLYCFFIVFALLFLTLP